MEHIYIEGCTCTSLTVDGIETIDLPIEKFREAVIELVNNCDDIATLQFAWKGLMESMGTYEDLGHCDQCGDYIDKYTLTI